MSDWDRSWRIEINLQFRIAGFSWACSWPRLLVSSSPRLRDALMMADSEITVRDVLPGPCTTTRTRPLCIGSARTLIRRGGVAISRIPAPWPTGCIAPCKGRMRVVRAREDSGQRIEPRRLLHEGWAHSSIRILFSRADRC